MGRKSYHSRSCFCENVSKGETPEEMPIIIVKASNIVEILIETKLSSSKGDARRLIEQGD